MSFTATQSSARQIPVLVFSFIRPWALKILLGELKRIQPRTLYLVSDGGRSDSEWELIEECRLMAGDVDWPCDVIPIFASENLGMKRIAEVALKTAFQRETGVLILEDDCIPSPASMDFINSVLKQVGDDPKIASIGLFNPLGRTPFTKHGSALASRSFRSWGQYMKREHWLEYLADGVIPKLTSWQAFAAASRYPGLFTKALKFRIFYSHRKDVGNGDISISLFFRRKGYLSIVPTCSLLVNIGSGADATHTSFLPYATEFPKCAETEFSIPSKFRVTKLTDRLEGVLVLLKWLRSHALSLKNRGS